MRTFLERVFGRTTAHEATAAPSTWPSRLEQLGWFRFVDAATADDAKRAIIAAPPYVLAGEVKRVFHADAEELSEGRVRDFVGMVAEFLRAEGIDVDVTFLPRKRPPGADPEDRGWLAPVNELRVRTTPGAEMVDIVDEENDGGDYVVRVGERRFVVTKSGENGWGSATVATLDLLNALLAERGSRERAWAHMGGNDLHIVFATPEAFSFINSTLDPRYQLHDGSKD